DGGGGDLGWHGGGQWLPWWLVAVGRGGDELAGLDDSESYVGTTVGTTLEWDLGGSAAHGGSIGGVADLAGLSVGSSGWSEGTVGESLLTSAADGTGLWLGGLVGGDELLDGIEVLTTLLEGGSEGGLVVLESGTSACLRGLVVGSLLQLEVGLGGSLEGGETSLGLVDAGSDVGIECLLLGGNLGLEGGDLVDNGADLVLVESLLVEDSLGLEGGGGGQPGVVGGEGSTSLEALSGGECLTGGVLSLPEVGEGSGGVVLGGGELAEGVGGATGSEVGNPGRGTLHSEGNPVDLSLSGINGRTDLDDTWSGGGWGPAPGGELDVIVDLHVALLGLGELSGLGGLP
ncbi:MAG: hypothetical protein VXZ35_00995, partial [Pseudomonadota bacterium]|nr:hypothetical protein [Pseudomonadota bacterium]